jgi:hypothetical protein
MSPYAHEAVYSWVLVSNRDEISIGNNDFLINSEDTDIDA